MMESRRITASETIHDAFRAIAEERHRQDALHGGPGHDDQNTEKDWIAVLVRQLGLATEDSTKDEADRVRFRRQMVRVAATAIAAIESLDRRTEGMLVGQSGDISGEKVADMSERGKGW